MLATKCREGVQLRELVQSIPFENARETVRESRVVALGKRLRSEFAGRDYRSILATLNKLGPVLSEVKCVPYECLALSNTVTLLNSFLVASDSEIILEATLTCVRILSSSAEYCFSVDENVVGTLVGIIENEENTRVRNQFSFLLLQKEVNRVQMRHNALFILANLMKYRSDICRGFGKLGLLFEILESHVDTEFVSGVLLCLSGIVGHDDVPCDAIASDVCHAFLTYLFDPGYPEKCLCLDGLALVVSRYPGVFATQCGPIFSTVIEQSKSKVVLDSLIRLLVKMLCHEETARIAEHSLSWSHIDALWCSCNMGNVIELIDKLVVFDSSKVTVVKSNLLDRLFFVLNEGSCQEQILAFQLFVDMSFIDTSFLELWISRGMIQHLLLVLSSDSTSAIHAGLSLLSQILTSANVPSVFSDPVLVDALAGVPAENAQLATALVHKICQTP